MAEVASAYVSIMPSARGFGSKLQSQVGPQTDGVGKKIGARFGKAFALAGAAGVVGAGAFLKGAVGEASDLAESQSKVGVVFGRSAAQIMAASKTSATAMGLSKAAYLDATGTFGNLLVSLDIGPKKAANMSQSMVKLAGDLASFNNTSPEEALEALKSGLTGETEPLKRFGVNMNDATLKAQALKMGLIKSTKEALNPQTKALSAQALIMAQTKTAQGDFARTSGGLANQQRILSAEFKDLQGTIGTALLPTVTRFVKFMTSSVVPAVRGFIAEMKSGAGAGGQFVAAVKQMGAAVVSVAGFINQHRTAAVALIGTITALVAITRIHAAVMAVEAAGGLLKMLASTNLVTAATRTYAAVQWVLNAALTANPIGLVIVAIAALAVGLVLAYKKSETFRAVINGVFSFLKSAVSATVGFIKSHWQLIAVIIGGPIAAAAILVARHWGKIKSVVSGAISAVIGFIKGNWQAILATLIAGPFGLAVSLIATHWGRIKSAVSGGVSSVVGVVKTLPGKIAAALGSLGSLLYGAGQRLIDGLISGIVSRIGAIGSAMSGIAGKIKGYLPGSPIKEGPLKGWNNGGAGIRLMHLLAKGIRSGKVHVGKAMVEALKHLQDSIEKRRDGVKSALDGLMSDFRALRDGIASSMRGDLFGAAATEAIKNDAGEVTTAAATAGQNFMSNLVAKKGELTSLLSAFKVLRGWGLKPEFLSQLFASGNGALALDLAGMGKAGATSAGALFGDVTSLSNQLGTAVAKNDPVSGRIDTTNKILRDVQKSLDAVGPTLAAALNQTAANAARGKAKKGKR